MLSQTALETTRGAEHIMKQLAEIIRSRGVTYRDIHAAGGPSPATLSRLLRGERRWRPEWVAVVSQILGGVKGDFEFNSGEHESQSDQPTHESRGRGFPARGSCSSVGEEEQILTTQEAAAYLKCSPSFLYRRRDLILPSYLGRRRRYSKQQLDEYLRRSGKSVRGADGCPFR